MPPATTGCDEAPVEDGLADAVRRLVAAVRGGLACREELALLPGSHWRSRRARVLARGRRLPWPGRRQQRRQPADRLGELFDPALTARKSAQGGVQLRSARVAGRHGNAVDRELDDIVAAQAEATPPSVWRRCGVCADSGVARAHASLPKERSSGGSGAGSGSPRAVRRTTRRLRRRRRRGRGDFGETRRCVSERRIRTRRTRTAVVASASKMASMVGCWSFLIITMEASCTTRIARDVSRWSPSVDAIGVFGRGCPCRNTAISTCAPTPHDDQGRRVLGGIQARLCVIAPTTLAHLTAPPQVPGPSAAGPTSAARRFEPSWSSFRANSSPAAPWIRQPLFARTPPWAKARSRRRRPPAVDPLSRCSTGTPPARPRPRGSPRSGRMRFGN